jgi:rhamnogalacturonan endolyase
MRICVCYVLEQKVPQLTNCAYAQLVLLSRAAVHNWKIMIVHFVSSRWTTIARTVSFFALLLAPATAILNATEDSKQLVLSNDRLHAAVNKSTGAIDVLSLDGQDLLGDLNYVMPTPGGATGSGNNGIGPYLDCYCIPSGSYTPGSIDPQ